MERTQEGSFQGSQEAHQRTLNQKPRRTMPPADLTACGLGLGLQHPLRLRKMVLRLCLSDSRLAQGIRKMQAWESALPVGPLAAI